MIALLDRIALGLGWSAIALVALSLACCLLVAVGLLLINWLDR